MNKHDPERLLKAGIPVRFHGKTLAAFQPDSPAQTDALAWATAFAANYRTSPQCALLVGRTGTGKTHLAAGIALEALLTDYVEQVHFTTVQKAIRRVKDSWTSKPGSESEREARMALTSPRLLILDEVGMNLGTEFEQRLFFDVLNERHEAMKPTILISNLNLKDVQAYLGLRVIDRMREDGGKLFVFDWESHRGAS